MLFTQRNCEHVYTLPSILKSVWGGNNSFFNVIYVETSAHSNTLLVLPLLLANNKIAHRSHHLVDQYFTVLTSSDKVNIDHVAALHYRLHQLLKWKNTGKVWGDPELQILIGQCTSSLCKGSVFPAHTETPSQCFKRRAERREKDEFTK